MADIVEPCNDCGRIYNKSKLTTCPGCSALRQDDAARVPALNRSGRSAFAEVRSDNELLEALVQEARATRLATQSTANQLAALASFLWLSTVFGIISGVFFVLASINADYDGKANSNMTIIAIIIAVIGTILSLASLFEAARARLSGNSAR